MSSMNVTTLYIPESRFNTPLSEGSNIPHLSCRAAVGPVSGSGGLQSHPISNAFVGTVDLQSGTAALETSSGDSDRKSRAHAILMIVGWGLLLPFGTLFARCKEWGPIWFQFHRAIQVTGLISGVSDGTLVPSSGSFPFVVHFPGFGEVGADPSKPGRLHCIITQTLRIRPL